MFFIDVSVQLKNETVFKQLVKFFDCPHTPNFKMVLRRNKNPLVGPTLITARDELEIQWITQKLPNTYKTMLNSEPYIRCLDWKAFRKNFW